MEKKTTCAHTHTHTKIKTHIQSDTHTQSDEGKLLEINSGSCAGKQVKCGLKVKEWREIVSTGRDDGGDRNTV